MRSGEDRGGGATWGNERPVFFSLPPLKAVCGAEAKTAGKGALRKHAFLLRNEMLLLAGNERRTSGGKAAKNGT